RRVSNYVCHHERVALRDHKLVEPGPVIEKSMGETVVSRYTVTFQVHDLPNADIQMRDVTWQIHDFNWHCVFLGIDDSNRNTCLERWSCFIALHFCCRRDQWNERRRTEQSCRVTICQRFHGPSPCVRLKQSPHASSRSAQSPLAFAFGSSSRVSP